MSAKRIPFIFLILLSLVFAGAVNRALADAAGLMKQADRLYDGHSYCQTEQLYRTIVENYPNTDYALAAQRKLVCVLIGGEKPSEQVDAEFNKLVTDFANNEQLPAQIDKIGFNCRGFGKYQKAKYYYNYVIENFPDNPQAIFSQKDLVKTAIEAEDATAEQQALDELKSKFANHPDLPKSLCSVGDGYIKKGEYDKANGLNEYIVSNFPKNTYALRAQKNLIKCYIASGDDEKTNAAVLKLANAFIDFPGQWKVVKRIADMLCDKRKFETATGMYQHLIETYPDDTDLINWRKGLAIVKINMGDDAGVQKILKQIITDFNDSPQLPKAVFQIGEEYYHKALKDGNTGANNCFSKALIVLKRIIDEMSASAERRATVYFVSAVCYDKLGDYAKAAEHYEKVVETCPDYEFAWNAQFMAARYYEKLGRSGDISKSEAKTKSTAAYRKLLAKYPNCKAARGVRIKLSK